MSDPISLGLLPEGLRDVLPPAADAETRLLRQLLEHLAGHGYERVSPPLVEFEETLAGPVKSAARDLFRFIDPVSQRTLAVRADITGQVARIASHRLGHYARPLRLSYAGPVLRVKGTQLRADRQFLQAGAELIGADSADAAAEVAILAVESLAAIGLEGLSLDITLPDFLGHAAHDLPPDQQKALGQALDTHDGAALAALGLPQDPFGLIFQAVGPAGAALETLGRAALPAAARERVLKAAALFEALRDAAPALPVTLDPGEQRGFSFQTSLGFSLFAKGVRGEVGRGGAYAIERPGGGTEPAVGFSLYLDGLLDAGRGVEPRRRVFVPASAGRALLARLRAEGWVTVRSLGAADADGARAQRCGYILDGETPQPLGV